MTLRKCVSVAVVLLSFAACSRHPEGEPMIARSLESPALPGSGEANLTLAPDGRVLLSWIEPVGDTGHRLRIASRTNGGGWSPPLTVAEGTDWFVNWADFPSVVSLPDGTLFAHWLAKSGASPYAYDVRITRSRDGGKTWSAPVIPHRDGTPSEHGFVSLLSWHPGEVGIVWLDGRKKPGVAHADDGATPEAMSLMHTTLDRDGRLGPETVLDDRVCDCCQTDAVTAKGTTVVVYRDRSEQALTVADSSAARSSGFPRIVRSGSEVTIAWRDAGEPPRVRTAAIAIGASK